MRWAETETSPYAGFRDAMSGVPSDETQLATDSYLQIGPGLGRNSGAGISAWALETRAISV